MFGMNSQSRGGMLRPFQELEQITSSLFGRSQKLDFDLDVRDQGRPMCWRPDPAGAEKGGPVRDAGGNYLTISAQRSDQQQEDAADSYIRRERSLRQPEPHL